MEDRTRYTALWIVFTTVGLAGVGFGILAGQWESVGLAAVLMTASWVGLATAERLRVGSESGRPAAAAERVEAEGAVRPTGLPGTSSRPLPSAPRQPVSLSPVAVLSALMESVAGIADPVGASLWLLDEPSGTFRQVASAGPMAPSAQPLKSDGECAIARASSTGAAEVEQVARVRTGGEPTLLWRIAIPVVADESRGVAAIELRSDEDPSAIDLPGATAHLRSALAAALALHIARTELDTARALVDVARDLSRILDEHEVITTTLSRAMEISSAATGSVMLLDAITGRLEIAASRGLPDEVVRTTSLAEGEGIAGWVLATDKPVLVEDLPARTPAARRHGIRSAVSVPIADSDGTIGVLNVGSRSFPARFTESHMGALEMLGKQCATALRNARAVAESRAIYFDTLKALALALETKDPYSRGGTERVLEVADVLGRAFQMEDEEREALRIAALLHDMGMTAVGEGVTHTDRTLTTVERALLKMHPQIAAEILAEAPALRRVVPIVYHHHEWYDGGGYLGGLSGESIPIGARILAVADAFVAMTSDRPYRRAMTMAEALRELTDKAGTQFDPAVVDALRDILRSGSDRVPGPSSDR